MYIKASVISEWWIFVKKQNKIKQNLFGAIQKG